jgi:serine/threonine protein kinase
MKEVVIGGKTYEVQSTVGSGMFGTVLSAKTSGSDTLYAIKTIGREMIDSAITETTAMRILDHPNIVKLVGVSHKRESTSIVMEYRGQSLSRRKFDSETCRRILFQLLHACLHMEERGVIHRDLKPQNIVIDDKGIPTIVDFGCASVIRSDTRDNNIISLWWKTPSLIPAYMNYDNRVDVWSLGIILFNIATGEDTLFNGRDEVSYMKDVARCFPNGEQWLSERGYQLYGSNRPTLRERLMSRNMKEDEMDMICHMVALDYSDIPSIRSCLDHPYLSSLVGETPIPMPRILSHTSPYPMVSKILRHHRVRLFEWIAGVCVTFRQTRHVFLHTIALFDMYEKVILSGVIPTVSFSDISKDNGIPRDELQVVGTACLDIVTRCVISNRTDYWDLPSRMAGAKGQSRMDEYRAYIYASVGHRVVYDIPCTNTDYIYACIMGDVLDNAEARSTTRAVPIDVDTAISKLR